MPQETGLQTFLRMANLYNPQQMEASGMPTDLPVNRQQPMLPNRQAPGISTPNAYPHIDETLQADWEMPGELPTPQTTLEAFRQNVLNPPQRQHMTYPKTTLNGLHKALEIAAEPSPLAKNRVWVDGNAYQKQKVFTDKNTGEKHYITDVHEPSFMSQVMRAMPASIEGSIDLANQGHADAVADWELKNKGLQQASAAESQMALANQRNVAAANAPRALDIKQMDAETRARVAALKDLPDSEKLRLLQEGKVTIEDMRAAASMARTIEGGNQARQTEGIRQEGRVQIEGIRQENRQKLEQIKQTGRISLEETKALNDEELEELRQSGRLSLEGARQVNREINIRKQGEQSRQTKATPGAQGASAANYPTQQRVAMQNHVQQLINQNPEWADYITFNEQGFPEIAPPKTSWYQSGPDQATHDKMYEAVYGPNSPTAKGQAPQAPATNTPGNVPVPPPTQEGVQPIIQHSQSTGQYRISYDGGKTWRPYNPNGKQ